MSAPLPSPTSANEEALLRLLRTSETRGSSLSTADKAEVERLARELEGGGGGGEDTNLSPLLGGRWRVLFQGKPGEDVSPTSLESWKRYFAGEGPSPVQNLVSGAGSVNRLYQILQIEGSSGEFVNVSYPYPEAYDTSPFPAILPSSPPPLPATVLLSVHYSPPH